MPTRNTLLPFLLIPLLILILALSPISLAAIPPNCDPAQLPRINGPLANCLQDCSPSCSQQLSQAYNAVRSRCLFRKNIIAKLASYPDAHAVLGFIIQRRNYCKLPSQNAKEKCFEKLTSEAKAAGLAPPPLFPLYSSPFALKSNEGAKVATQFTEYQNWLQSSQLQNDPGKFLICSPCHQYLFGELSVLPAEFSPSSNATSNTTIVTSFASTPLTNTIKAVQPAFDFLYKHCYESWSRTGFWRKRNWIYMDAGYLSELQDDLVLEEVKRDYEEPCVGLTGSAEKTCRDDATAKARKNVVATRQLPTYTVTPATVSATPTPGASQSGDENTMAGALVYTVAALTVMSLGGLFV